MCVSIVSLQLLLTVTSVGSARFLFIERSNECISYYIVHTYTYVVLSFSFDETNEISGERLIQYATENLVTEVLIHPQTNTLLQCIRNLLASFTKHRHIIHAGYTFGGNGSWILQVRMFLVSSSCTP